MTFHGPELTLPSVYHVSAFASVAVAAATLAVAELAAVRNGSGKFPVVTIDRTHARSRDLLERTFVARVRLACRGLTRWIGERRNSSARLSLARVARALMELGEGGCELADTQFGRVRRVRCPGSIAGFSSVWSRTPGALGCDEARW